MDLQIANPAARAGANRVQDIKDFATALDILNPTETAIESLAVRLVAQRYRVSIARARTICSLAGIGGEA